MSWDVDLLCNHVKTVCNFVFEEKDNHLVFKFVVVLSCYQDYTTVFMYDVSIVSFNCFKNKTIMYN